MASITSSESASNPYAALNAASTKSTNSTDVADSGQDRFLTLLVAQMKNQDPLNPLDNAQVTSQLAQINTVNGIEKLNHTLTKLLESNQDTQALQAATVVGRQVLADGNGIVLAGATARAGFELADGADQVTITVSSAGGQLVHRATLANLAPGIHTFEWDGKTDAGAAAADGRYSFAVSAKLGGANAPVAPLAVSRVDGVSNSSSGISVRTSSGTLDWTKIKQVM